MASWPISIVLSGAGAGKTGSGARAVLVHRRFAGLDPGPSVLLIAVSSIRIQGSAAADFCLTPLLRQLDRI
jgi:hypothetical protein